MSTQATSQPGHSADVVVHGLSRWYGNVVAVNDISFTIGTGITGLLGPNGAGKSTVLHTLSGFLKPSAGTVEVLGEPAWRNPSLYRSLGLVADGEAVYPFQTGREFVLLNARLHGLRDAVQAADRAIAVVGMQEAQDRKTGGYSKGMKQRIKIAAAIVHEPQVLLLDEPFSGTDPTQRLHMMNSLEAMAKQGKTILFSSHVLEEVERLSDNVLVIINGRLAASGDFHAIRKLMIDRPHQFTIRSADNRRLASALMAEPAVSGVELAGDAISVRTQEFAAFTVAAPKVARAQNIRLLELLPTDESLESVFAYLVKR
ncbi:MAG: ABC transporter ATP-binding protein [Chloroflexota bacterium]